MPLLAVLKRRKENQYMQVVFLLRLNYEKNEIRSLSSTIALLVMINALSVCSLTGCATDDLGLCTISATGDDLVYEEISIEECQDIFVSTVGARGWSWDPQD